MWGQLHLDQGNIASGLEKPGWDSVDVFSSCSTKSKSITHLFLEKNCFVVRLKLVKKKKKEKEKLVIRFIWII